MHAHKHTQMHAHTHARAYINMRPKLRKSSRPMPMTSDGKKDTYTVKNINIHKSAAEIIVMGVPR